MGFRIVCPPYRFGSLAVIFSTLLHFLQSCLRPYLICHSNPITTLICLSSWYQPSSWWRPTITWCVFSFERLNHAFCFIFQNKTEHARLSDYRKSFCKSAEQRAICKEARCFLEACHHYCTIFLEHGGWDFQLLAFAEQFHLGGVIHLFGFVRFYSARRHLVSDVELDLNDSQTHTLIRTHISSKNISCFKNSSELFIKFVSLIFDHSGLHLHGLSYTYSYSFANLFFVLAICSNYVISMLASSALVWQISVRFA